MVFEVREVDLAGRIGRIYTRHGVIETPAFFPVIDVARQEVPIREVVEAGFGQVITNAYLVWRRFGAEAASRGVHSVLGFDGPVMTDSGAYQILEYGGVEVGQDEIVEYQKAIGSDIAVILDIPTGDVSRSEAERSVEETLRRAVEASRLVEGDERIWVLPVQGGRYFDLVEESARRAATISGYGMYGIGSPTVFLERYMYDVVIEAVRRAKLHLPWGRPVHLFGAGHPLIIPFAVAMGVDTFDSASYILYARDGRYMTEGGVYRLEELDYLPCSCPVCSRRSPEDLREAERHERTRMLALHNLYTISATLRRVKLAIREGRLWELLEEASRRHPAAARAMSLISRHTDMLSRGAPLSRGSVKGVRAYGVESLNNPKLQRFRDRSRLVLRLLAERYGGGRALFKPLEPKPQPGECERLVGGDPWIIYYQPFVGVFPVELCGAYPSIHVDHPGLGLPREVLEDLAGELEEAARMLSESGYSVELTYCSGVEWSSRLSSILAVRGLRLVDSC
ncbi:MAG: tRNA guanosine(15) transglycosylase TgtA [Aeropyrum sp.]|nr:tRNA guanosine(15) transglycosylase TgtA [Aeropyrum sp.]MCE4616698.1 tRNA guanosine(15) transglycosylase TgtA [Aeropyrum sp.]